MGLLKIASLSVGLIILLLQLFLYINADAVYGTDAPKARNEIFVYLLLQVSVLSAFAIKLPTLNLSPAFFINFIVGFAIFSLFIMLIPKLTVLTMGAVGVTALGYGFIHVFVKAYTEEVVFRNILPKIGLGHIISNVLFGFFHFAVSGGSVVTMIFLTVLGFVFTLFYKMLGTMGAVGAHVAYNSWVMGILKRIFRVF